MCQTSASNTDPQISPTRFSISCTIRAVCGEIFIPSSLVGNDVIDKYFKYKYTVWLRAAGDYGCHSGDTTHPLKVNSLEQVSGFVRVSVFEHSARHVLLPT